jgi:hypothetical protein
MRHEHCGHEKTRRGSAGFFKTDKGVSAALEHAEYDGADKGEGDVSGHHAQSADEGTKGHRNSPELTSLPALSAEINNARFAKKGRLAVYPPHLGAAQSCDSWLKSREIKALMSP